VEYRVLAVPIVVRSQGLQYPRSPHSFHSFAMTDVWSSGFAMTYRSLLTSRFFLASLRRWRGNLRDRHELPGATPAMTLWSVFACLRSRRDDLEGLQ